MGIMGDKNKRVCWRNDDGMQMCNVNKHTLVQLSLSAVSVSPSFQLIKCLVKESTRIIMSCQGSHQHEWVTMFLQLMCTTIAATTVKHQRGQGEMLYY